MQRYQQELWTPWSSTVSHDLLPKDSWMFWPRSIKNITCLSGRVCRCRGFGCLRATKTKNGKKRFIIHQQKEVFVCNHSCTTKENFWLLGPPRLQSRPSKVEWGKMGNPSAGCYPNVSSCISHRLLCWCSWRLGCLPRHVSHMFKLHQNSPNLSNVKYLTYSYIFDIFLHACFWNSESAHMRDSKKNAPYAAIKKWCLGCWSRCFTRCFVIVKLSVSCSPPCASRSGAGWPLPPAIQCPRGFTRRFVIAHFFPYPVRHRRVEYPTISIWMSRNFPEIYLVTCLEMSLLNFTAAYKTNDCIRKRLSLREVLPRDPQQKKPWWADLIPLLKGFS